MKNVNTKLEKKDRVIEGLEARSKAQDEVSKVLRRRTRTFKIYNSLYKFVFIFLT
jgi:hypothetical protein